MSLSGSPRSIAQALADVFVTGPWDAGEVLERGTRILGRRGRWVRPLIGRVLAAHPGSIRPRSEKLVDFLLADPGFRRACSRHDITLRFDRCPSAVMSAGAGPPSTWVLPSIVTVADLAVFLEVEPATLDWFADRAGLLAKLPDGPLRHYRYEWRKKRSGELRLIEAPKSRLKQIQRKVLSNILDRIPPHDAAHGFRSGRSIVSFARPHVGRGVVLKMDLRDFFASIPSARVLSIFLTAGYPDAVARAITGLCTNRAQRDVFRRAGWATTAPGSDPWKLRQLYGKPHLPQGAPTSPALANLSAFRLDARLTGLALVAGGRYTRYADDIVFSGDDSFARGIEGFANSVAAIAIEEGFRINHRKTRIMRPSGRQQVAGVVVNEHPNTPRTEFERLKAILHNCERLGPDSQNRAALDDFRAHLVGRIAHVTMVNPNRGRRLEAMLARVTW